MFVFHLQVFSQMVSNRETIKFAYLENVLSAAVAELKRNTEKLKVATNKDDIVMVQVRILRISVM